MKSYKTLSTKLKLKYSTKDHCNIKRLAFLAVNVLENVSCLRIAFLFKLYLNV